MIRLIVEVTAPDVDAGVPGVYRTFDIVNKELQDLFASGLKPIIGHEIRADPPAPKPPEKPAEKKDPDALPPNATALETYKHKKALELKGQGKLPAKLKPDEPILEQYERYVAAQRVASAAETAKNKSKSSNDNGDEKARQEFNKRVKVMQETWDARPLWNKLRGIPRPTKESVREADKAAA